MKIAGILLVIAGFAAILCGEFSYTTHMDNPDMGLILFDDSVSYTMGISPVLGIAGIAAGFGLIFFSIKQHG
jgi:2-methylisocitrate lyase-like PEP mutase family enzyme